MEKMQILENRFNQIIKLDIKFEKQIGLIYIVGFFLMLIAHIIMVLGLNRVSCNVFFFIIPYFICYLIIKYLYYKRVTFLRKNILNKMIKFNNNLSKNVEETKNELIEMLENKELK